MDGKRMMRFGVLAITLTAAVIGAMIVGPTVAVRMHAAYRAIELAAAYPALRLDEAIVALTPAGTAGPSSGGTVIVYQTGAREWFGFYVSASW